MERKDLCRFTHNGKTYVALVRKLTETEAFRLMGVDDPDILKIEDSGVSRTNCYKLAGNSIVVDVLYHLFRKLFIDLDNEEEQLGLFDVSNPPQTYTKENPLRVVTLCSGYDSQCLALERLKRDYPEFDYELVAWSEYDPCSNLPLDKQPAVVAHNALFPQWADRNLGDMTKIDWNKVADFDMLFYSTPCQSISQAGLQHGFVEGSGTRSSIIWDVRDALLTKRPKYACLENVAAMVSSKFLPMFNLWREEVGGAGYDNFAKVLNAKNYNVPQNRDRVFLMSVRKDLGVQYHFPKKMDLEKLLTDVLEEVVDTKYYLNPFKVDKFIKDNLIMIEDYLDTTNEKIEPLPAELKEWMDNYPDTPEEEDPIDETSEEEEINEEEISLFNED